MWFKRLVDWVLRRVSPDAQPPADEHAPSPGAEAPPSADLAKRVDRAVRTPPRAERSRKRAKPTIVIGLDFGTSSTKVVVRQQGDEHQPSLFVLDAPTDDYPWFVTPSLVRIVDDRAWFGKESAQRTGGRMYDFLKVELVPTASQAEGLNRKRRWKAAETDLLVTAFLSWILGEIAIQLDEQYGRTNYRALVNSAAPMGHAGNPALKHRYLRILGTAWDSVFGPEPAPALQGDGIQDLAVRFGHQLRLDAPIPGKGARAYEILPETIAPLVTILESNTYDHGLYVVADVGAGTTEVLCVYLKEDRGDDHPVVCYSDASSPIGMVDLDAADIAGSGLHDPSRPNEFVNSLDRLIRAVVFEGFSKDRGNRFAAPRWRTVTMISVGGGSRRNEVQKLLASEKSLRAVLNPGKTEQLNLDRRWLALDEGMLAVAPTPHMPEDASREEFHLLGVAVGLSVHRELWPPWYDPADVETIRSDGDPVTPIVDYDG